MMTWTIRDILGEIKNQGKSPVFQDLYGDLRNDSSVLTRISDLIARSEGPVTHLFSAPGRTELGGNHTDHNQGIVLCAAVRKDMLAAVSKRSDSKIMIRSDGFTGTFEMDITDLNGRSSELGKTIALIRGVLAGIDDSGGRIGGFSAEITSNVGVGSGLSSSASFEVLIGTIVNNLYNESTLTPEKIAQIGQYAENTFFGKPCGLMDQTASAVGGIMKIDFADPENIDIQKVKFDLDSTDYVLAVVNTGSSHEDLTQAYASIPLEMKKVAKSMGANILREVDETAMYSELNRLKNELGDRATLRAMHFFQENIRVDLMVAALESGEFDQYLQYVNVSGASSHSLLQNTSRPGNDGVDQGLAFAMGLSQVFFEKRGRGVARVHGGGFAGTVQVYIHQEDFDDYKNLISDALGRCALQVLNIRHQGACEILILP